MSLLLALLMSVDLVNDCVVLPNPPTWQRGVQVRREWQTAIARAVTGAEARATGRAPAPYVRMKWDTLPRTVQDGARLRARIREALKRGRACAPFFVRQQYIAGRVNMLAGMTFPPIGVFNVAVIPGRRYYWSPAPNPAIVLQNGPKTLFAAQEFVALFEQVTVIGQPNIPVDSILHDADMHVSELATIGLWPWAAGQYAFFSRDADGYHENRDVLVNVGTEADAAYCSGGAALATGAAIDCTLIGGYPAPDEAVFQTARALVTADPAAAIVCEIEGLHLGIDCNVRLHFAEIEAGMDGSIGRRVFDVLVNGALVAADVEPYAMAGYWLNRAVCLDALVQPDHLGKITITLEPRRRIEVFAVSYFETVNPAMPLHVLDSVMVPAGALVLLKDQPDATQNGLYQVGEDHTLTRADCANTGRKLEVLTAIYASNGIGNGAKTFRCSNAGKITLGATEIAFAEILPDAQYRAGLNAVELRQYTWEIVELTAGTGPNLLKWEGYLKGRYTAGDHVYPVIFGRPSAMNMQAHDVSISSVGLAIEEPLGDGQLAVDTCPAEACLADPLIALPETEDPGTLTPIHRAPRGDTWEPFYVRDYDQKDLPVGYNSVEPPLGLWANVLERWARDVWDKWEAYKLAQNIHPTEEALIWFYTNPDQAHGDRWYANSLFGLVPGQLEAFAEYQWTIVVDYVV